MSRSKKKSALINIVFGLVYQGVNTICNMILPPLIISVFGSAVNGLIGAIKQLLNYAQLVGTGISVAATQSLYKPLIQNDKKKIAAMNKGVGIVFFKSGIVFSCITALCAIIYPLFIINEGSYIVTMLLVIILGMAGASEFFVLGKYRTLLMADQKGYIVNIAQSIGVVLNILICCIFIKCGMNIVFVQLGGTVVYISRIIIVVSYIKKVYPFLNNGYIEPDFSGLHKRKDAAIQSIMGTVTLNSQTLILSIFVGLKEASVYTVYNLVFYGLYNIISSLTNTLTPTIGLYMVDITDDKLKKFYNLYEYIFIIFLFVLVTLSTILIVPFINLYTNNATDINYTNPIIAIFFLSNFFLNCLRIPAITLINAGGYFEETRNGAIIETIISITVQLISVKFLGIYGVLIGTFCALLFRSMDLIIFSIKKIIKIKYIYSLRRLIVNFVMYVIIIYLFFNINIIIDSWMKWVEYAVLYSIIISMAYIIINLLIDYATFIEVIRILKSNNFFKKVKKNGR